MLPGQNSSEKTALYSSTNNGSSGVAPGPASGGGACSQPQQQESNKKAKKRAQHNEPAVSDLLRKVKKDASRSAGDWKSMYEERKRLALENIEKAKEGGLDVNISSMSATFRPTNEPSASAPHSESRFEFGPLSGVLTFH